MILSSTCHPNLGFLLKLCLFLEEIILCYLTLFSQVYFFRYLIKNFKVSICITLMYMVDLLLSIYCLQGENLVHVDTLMSHIYIALMHIAKIHVACIFPIRYHHVICTSSGGVQGSSYLLHVSFKAFIQTSTKSVFEALMYVVINYQKGGD